MCQWLLLTCALRIVQVGVESDLRQVPLHGALGVSRGALLLYCSFFWSENPSESVIVGRPTTLPFSLPCVRLTRSFIRKGQFRLQTDTRVE